ncbi:Phosphate transporter PHO1 (Protein PHO1) (AtPHO1) [Durusdinium trenchii]|uniref:Phosphate transporter PHO1 (Protein PHO1) (AtPHO1) n=1 Tax=Durusdinium trenchii TaxID=1381693 RepID=A0ABP0KFN1_9DINO
MALHELESVPEGHCSSTAFWFCIFPFDQSSKVSFHPSLPNPVTPAPASPCVGGTLQELTHFCEANDTVGSIAEACYKILKKHDKQTGLNLMDTMLPQMKKEAFSDPGKARLSDLQKRLRRFGDELGRDHVRFSLRLPREATERQVARISFCLGVISMALLVLLVLSGMEPQIDQYSAEDLAATIPVLRLSFMMNLTAWLAGSCAWVFEHYKINYLFLLDISPDLEVSAMALMNYASLQTGVWILLTFCFLADMKFGAVLVLLTRDYDFSLAHVYACAVLFAQFAICVWHSTRAHRHLFVRGSELGIQGLLVRIFCFSCLGEVSFAENVVADVLTSLGRPLKDVAYTVCYFRHWHTDHDREVRQICKSSAWTSPMLQFLLLLPLLFRVAQCLRRLKDSPRSDAVKHSLNCGKYLLAVLVSLLNSMSVPPSGWTTFQLKLVQVFGYVAATVYATAWDLTVDFGLTHSNRRRIYPNASYLIAAALDTSLRSTWLLTLQPDCRRYVGASTFNKERPGTRGKRSEECFAFLISFLELFRRSMWATVRIEHEHLSNAGRFRSVCWVPPLEHRRSKAPVTAAERWEMLKRRATVVALVNDELKHPQLGWRVGAGADPWEDPWAEGWTWRTRSLRLIFGCFWGTRMGTPCILLAVIFGWRNRPLWSCVQRSGLAAIMLPSQQCFPSRGKAHPHGAERR